MRQMKHNNNSSAMNYIFLFIFTAFFSLHFVHSLPGSLIINFFDQTHIDSITIISCVSLGKKLSALREITAGGLQVSFSWITIDATPKQRRGAVLDLDCPKIETIIAEINKEKIFNTHTEWLVINRINSKTSYSKKGNLYLSEGMKAISASYVLPGSCVRFVQLLLDTGEAYYFDMYRVSMLRPMKFQLDWTGPYETSLPNEIPQCAERNRSNLDGIFLKGGSSVVHKELIENFDKIHRDDVPEVDFWAMVHYPIAKLIAEQLNSVLEMVLMDDYGYLTNGSFDGLMGLLQRDEVDFAATGLIIRHSRFIAVQFTAETFELKTAVISKQPPLSSASNIFLLPFSQLVWIACCLLSLMVTAILILEYILSKHMPEQPYSQKYTTMADLITMVLSTICQQGTELAPVSLSARITVFLFSLFAFFCFTSYSANIVALLQSSAPILKNLNDITNSPLGVKVQNLTYNRFNFRSAVAEDVINLYKKKVKPQGEKAYCEPIDGMKLMRTGKFAFSVETNHAYRIISDTFEEHEKCGLSEIRIFFIPKLAVGVVRRSGYREQITRKVTWQREIGLLSRIKSVWLPQKPHCESGTSTFISVTIEDFMPALLVFAYGAVAAFTVLAMENVHYFRINCFSNRIGTDIKKIQLNPEVMIRGKQKRQMN